MRDAALEFVTQQSGAATAAGERLIGSSEVLESLIGKYKQLQSTHSKGGMTAMLLSFGSIVSNKTQRSSATRCAGSAHPTLAGGVRQTWG